MVNGEPEVKLADFGSSMFNVSLWHKDVRDFIFAVLTPMVERVAPDYRRGQSAAPLPSVVRWLLGFANRADMRPSSWPSFALICQKFRQLHPDVACEIRQNSAVRDSTGSLSV